MKNKKPIKKNPVRTAGVNRQSSREKPSFAKLESLMNGANIILLAVFVFAAFYYLVVLNKNLLFKLQDFSFFLPSSDFFFQQMKVPSGFISWLGLFLTQFFYYPWLGAGIFILLALAVQFVAIKAFKIPTRFYPVTFIIPFALVLSITQLGYMIFALKQPGYVYVPELGLACALAAVLAYRSVSSVMVKTVAVILFVLVGYPFLGFYALLGVGLICLYEFIELIKEKQTYRLIPILTGIIAVLLIPYILSSYFYTQADAERIYMLGLPVFYEPERFCWIPYMVLFVAIFGFSFLMLPDSRKSIKPVTLFIGLSIYVLSFYGLSHFSFNDDNFQTELAMDRASFANNWEEVLKLARKNKSEPTRLIVMQTNLALQKLGRGGDEMFSYKNGNKEMNAPWPVNLLSHSGKSLYFHYGKINYSYRWSMEDMCERGVKIEDLRYMVKCALLKSELNLARRYNDLLKQTLFYKDWAAKYQQYINNPRLMDSDPEFKSLKPLVGFEDDVYGDDIGLELYLLNTFSRSECKTPEMLEIAIQDAMLLRNSDLFWPKFFDYVSTHKVIPRHYQEAALMFSYYEKKVDVSKLNFDTELTDRFNQFVSRCQQDAGLSKEMREADFASSFGDTFWNYCFFGTRLKAE